MRNPKISVMIPVYNAKKTIRQCLDSVLNQTYKNYEVILVDNNSTDGTTNILKEFEKNNKRVKYFLELKQGRGAARNVGIIRCSGKIIAMTDSDCIVPKNWLEDLTRPIRKEGEKMVMGGENNIEENFWTKRIQKLNLLLIEHLSDKEYVNHLDTKNFAIDSKLMKKEKFDSDLGALEDFDFYMRIKNIAKIKLLNDLKVGHLHRSSMKETIKMSMERGYFINKIFQKYERKSEIKKEAMFESLSLKSNLLFLPWIFVQFIKKPMKEAFFLFIFEGSWRLGLIKFKICKMLKRSFLT